MNIGKSVKEQILDITTSYLHCSMCGCKIDDIPGEESSSEIIDGHVYCGTQNSYSNGCKHKKGIKILTEKLVKCIQRIQKVKKILNC